MNCGLPAAWPAEDRPLDLVEVPPWPLHLDQLGLEGAVERLGHRVVVRVRDGSDRGGGTDVGEPLGVPNGQVLTRFDQWMQPNPTCIERLTQDLAHGILY
jgi:hypothetical protein